MRPVPPRHLIGILLLLCAALAASGDDLSYRDRGNRHEGKKPRPIGGFDVDLLGAMAVPAAEPPVGAGFGDTAAVSFFLPGGESPHLVVRERRPRHSYWLDQARPASPWRPRAVNTFTWPAGDVLRPLGIAPADLLVLVRLGDGSPQLEERVAPALLAPVPGGGRIGEYRFTFKTKGTAVIRHAVYGPGSQRPLEPAAPRVRRAAEVPFTLAWAAGSRPEGAYLLVLDGYFEGNSHPVQREVEFFHSPVWPR
jgi:hypothetical protein